MPAGDGPFSIIDVYLEAAQTGLILGYDHTADEWLDVGKPEALPAAAEFLKKNRSTLEELKNTGEGSQRRLLGDYLEFYLKQFGL